MLIKHATTHIDKVFKSYRDFNSFIKIAGKTDKQFSSRVLTKVASIPVIQADPDKFLFIRNRSISGGETWGPNQNYDFFPSDELQTKYSSFLNCRISVDHKWSDDNDTIGLVIDSVYVPKQIYNERTLEMIPFSEEKLAELNKNGEIARITGDYIENLLAIDKERADAKRPGLVHAIINGEVSDTSMGCSVEKSECSVCHNIAEVENEFCEHISYGKGRKFKVGKKEVIAYEINYGISFFEDSIILSEEFAKKSGFRAEAGGEGADARAKIVEVIAGEKKVAKKTGTILDYVKAGDVEMSPGMHGYRDSVVIGEPDPEVEDMRQELRDELQDEIEEKKSILKNSKTADEFIKSAKHLDTELGLKRFWINASKSDKNDVLGLVKVFLKDGLEEQEILTKLEGIGYQTELIKEALEYENITNMDNKLTAQLKDFLVEGYRLFEKLSGGFQREPMSGGDMNPVAPELERRTDFVNNFESGVQEPASEISNGKDNPIWEKPQDRIANLKKRLAQIDMEEDVVNKEPEGMTKEGDNPDLDNEKNSKKAKQTNHWKDNQVDKGDAMLNGIGILDEEGFYGKESIEFGKDSGDPESYNDMKNQDKEFQTSDWGYVKAKLTALKQQLSPKDDEASVSTKEPAGQGKVKKDTYKSDEKEMLADYPVLGCSSEKISYLKQKLNNFDSRQKLVQDIIKFDSQLVWELDKEEYYQCLSSYNGVYDWWIEGMELYVDENILKSLLNDLIKISGRNVISRVNPDADELKESWEEEKENFKHDNVDKLPVDRTKGNMEEYVKKGIKKTADIDEFEDPDYREPGSEFTDEDFNFEPKFQPEFEPDDLFDINNPPAFHTLPEEELDKYQDWLSEKLFSPNLTPEEDAKITQLLDRISAEMDKYNPSEDWNYEALEGLAKKKTASPMGAQTTTELQPGSNVQIFKKDDAGNPTSEQVDTGAINTVEPQEGPDQDYTDVNINGKNYSTDDFVVLKTSKSELLEELANIDIDDKMGKLAMLKEIEAENIGIDDFQVEDFKEDTEDYGDIGDLFDNQQNPEPQTVAKKADLNKPGLKANRYSSIKKQETLTEEDLETMFDED